MTSDAVYAVPDLVEPVEAWRTWRVVERDPLAPLHSVVFDVPWPVRAPLTARCLRNPFLARLQLWRRHHDAPAPSCRCGIYAAPLRTALTYLSTPRPRPRRTYDVVGRVRLWGTVVECERGWRATFAYPTILYVAGIARAKSDAPHTLLARYGVPVVDIDEASADAIAAAEAPSEGDGVARS